MDNSLKFILIVLAVSVIVGLQIVSAQISSIEVIDDRLPVKVEDTLTETDTRKSFGYCPVNSDTETLFDKYGISYKIEGCPISRLYIDNWDKIDANTQLAIVEELKLKGYSMERE